MSEEEEGYYEEEGVDLLEGKDVVLPPLSSQQNLELEIQNIVRPGFEATENTSYYNLGALFVLLYAHVKEGVSVPALFTTDSVSNVKFDF